MGDGTGESEGFRIAGGGAPNLAFKVLEGCFCQVTAGAVPSGGLCWSLLSTGSCPLPRRPGAALAGSRHLPSPGLAVLRVKGWVPGWELPTCPLTPTAQGGAGPGGLAEEGALHPQLSRELGPSWC